MSYIGEYTEYTVIRLKGLLYRAAHSKENSRTRAGHISLTIPVIVLSINSSNVINLLIGSLCKGKKTSTVAFCIT